MSVITCQNSYGFRAIWSWQISSFYLDLREIQEITEILEIQAQICLNVSRMMQGVIGAISRGGFGGRNPLIVNHFSSLCLGSYGYNDTDLPPVSTPFHLY